MQERFEQKALSASAHHIITGRSNIGVQSIANSEILGRSANLNWCGLPS